MTEENCCNAFLMAPILIVVSMVILVCNEGNTLAMHRSLDEAVKKTVHLSNPDHVDAWDEGDMVHVVGWAVTTDVLQDQDFGVQPKDPVLKLKRNAEMYQWAESSRRECDESKDDDGSSKHTHCYTIYDYYRTWADHHIDSSRFYHSGHQNPPYMPFRNQQWTANPITLGKFTLPRIMVDQMNWYQRYYQVSIGDIPNPSLRSQAQYYENRNGIYLGRYPNRPQIGDERIWYDTVPQQIISLCAVQTGNTFAPYTAEAGKEILLLEPGNHTIPELYQHAHAAATNWAFVMRGVGFMLLWLGLRYFLEPLTFVAEHVPLLGPFLGQLVGAVAYVVTGLVAVVLSGTIVLCAWIGYRIAALDFLFWTVPLALLVAGTAGYLCLKSQRSDPMVAERQALRNTTTNTNNNNNNNNNNMPSYNEVPYGSIPEAQAIVLDDELENGSYQTVNPVAISVPSAPPAFMDMKAPL
ncbi:Transmembrane protein 43 [Seminavis robusta]|uniref:Transmembrane protein 43 n=1 Tax=Seminavis robusta TaxID=568900 RepID=A0A9N8HX15_9STRA|nr:Transmembrane protein 43 [Seminavis robusta]|eukprot:Sro1732_g294190.1 Transmembrane protein 43 (466) ;mRNA; r:18440-19837